MKEYETMLLTQAARAQKNAYAPYSHFFVGAAVLTKSGKVYQGCNIENSTYGATICAERTAMFSAMAQGEKEFVAIAICGSGSGFCYPCGICRQVMCEFAPNMTVLCVNEKGEYEAYLAKELLPHGFVL